MLIEALQAHCDQMMAEVFFSSGNAKLKEAAEAWAAEHDVKLGDWDLGAKWGVQE